MSMPIYTSRYGDDASKGASRVSIWLSWQTPLYCRYSALNLIKYQTLSLQIPNAGGLEQATAFPF